MAENPSLESIPPPTPPAELATPLPAAAHRGPQAAPSGGTLAKLTVGALGVVYGDIGTSPLYALKECFHGPHGSLTAMEIPSVPEATTYFLGRETLLPTGPSRMATWRKRLFVVMARNAQTASSFFRLPPNRVVEMGAQIRF